MSECFETNRLEAFSDGVFAIAITLLVLEIAVPITEFGDPASGYAVVLALALLAPQVAAFAFLAIAVVSVLAPRRRPAS